MKHGHHADFDSTCIECNREYSVDAAHRLEEMRAEVERLRAQVSGLGQVIAMERRLKAELRRERDALETKCRLLAEALAEVADEPHAFECRNQDEKNREDCNCFLGTARQAIAEAKCSGG